MRSTKTTQKIIFSISIASFVIFCFYEFLNNPHLITSDQIWPFSFAKDIKTGVNLSWYLPPNFFYLDVIIALLPTLMTGNIKLSMLIATPINLLLFCFVFSYLFCKFENENLLKIFVSLIVSIFAIFLLYKSYSNFTVFVASDIYSIDYILHFFFWPGSHGLSALASLIIFYYFFYKKNYNNFRDYKYYYLIFLFFTLSDFWFCVYFLPLIGFYYLMNLNKNNFIIIIISLLLTLVCILITFYLNPNLKSHLMNTISAGGLSVLSEGTNNSENGFSIDMLKEKYLLFFGLCFLNISLGGFFFVLTKYKKSNNFIKIIFFGSLISQAFIFLIFGMHQESIRYYMMLPSVNFLLLFYLIKDCSQDIFVKMNIVCLSIFLIFCIISFNAFQIQNYKSEYEDEIQCIKKLNEKFTFTLFSPYWPGKVIFEQTNRKNNLFQTDSDITEYKWIYNSTWNTLHKKSNGILIVNRDLNSELIKTLAEVNKGKYLCGNKLIYFNPEDIKFKKKKIVF